MIKNKVLSAVGVLTLIVVGAVLLNVYTDKSRADGSSFLFSGQEEQPTVKVSTKGTKSFGSATGPTSFFPCEQHNGVETCFFQQAVSAVASTTICRAQTPAATSSLIFASFTDTTATSSGLIFTLAKTANLNGTNASTSVMATGTIAASVKADFAYYPSATTTTTTNITSLGDGNTTSGFNIFGPNNYLTWTVTGSTLNLDVGTGARFAGGTCSAIFRSLN